MQYADLMHVPLLCGPQSPKAFSFNVPGPVPANSNRIPLFGWGCLLGMFTTHLPSYAVLGLLSLSLSLLLFIV